MPEIKQLFQLPTLPGIKRDGTMTDGDNWSDGQWVRFQRGRLRKMGGLVQVSPVFSGPSRAMNLWPASGFSNLTSYSQYGVEQVTIDSNGAGGAVIDRSPAGFPAASDMLWSVAAMYDASVGSTRSLLLAVPSPTVLNIDDRTNTNLYWADPADTTGIAFSSAGITGLTTFPMAGVFIAAPYAVLFGADGEVAWSDANLPKSYDTTGSGAAGDAGTARVTSLKIVKGLPLRTGQGAGGLLWSLDNVLRMDYIGGSQIFRFSSLCSESTIMAQNGVIEYDNMFYWVGIDRFLMTDGSNVYELPNQMNVNWFFDNLNYDQRQKIWAVKVPRFGEIWWFFPFGSATECTNAVIYNVREKTWYDTACTRSAGFSPKVFRYPIMANNATEGYRRLALTGAFTTAPLPGDMVLGTPSGATGLVNSCDNTNHILYVTLSTDTDFVVADVITGITHSVGATPPSVTENRILFDAYIHEKGLDLVEGGSTSGIEGYAVSNDFGLPTGGTENGSLVGMNNWTRLVRVEPDFIMSGEMAMTVIQREFPQTSDTSSTPYTFTASDGKIDTREQCRSIRLRFDASQQGSYFEQGRVILHTEPGDRRS